MLLKICELYESKVSFILVKELGTGSPRSVARHLHAIYQKNQPIGYKTNAHH